MPKQKQTYSRLQMTSCFVMLLALGWLTVSLPFVNKGLQMVKQLTEQAGNDVEEDGFNPLSNTNEEKSETGVTTLSEYLHEVHAAEQHFLFITRYYKCHPTSIYFAYHPELISPPPKA